jgi:hypothetical protein
MMCRNVGSRFINVCDDGGPGAEYSYAAYGHDCRDCGPRVDNTLPLCSSATMVGDMCTAPSLSVCGLNGALNNCGTTTAPLAIYRVAYSTVSPPPPMPPQPPGVPASPPAAPPPGFWTITASCPTARGA